MIIVIRLPRGVEFEPNNPLDGVRKLARYGETAILPAGQPQVLELGPGVTSTFTVLVESPDRATVTRETVAGQVDIFVIPDTGNIMPIAAYTKDDRAVMYGLVAHDSVLRI